MKKYKFLLQMTFFALLSLTLYHLLASQDKSNKQAWAEKEVQYRELVSTAPDSIGEALFVYQRLGLEVDTRGNMLSYPPTPHNELRRGFAYHHGFFLTFTTDRTCGNEEFTNNRLNLFILKESKWIWAESILLENVDFNHSSGTYSFSVQGFTINLVFQHDYECNGQAHWIELP